MITRRLFSFGLLAAPAVVHAGNLMPVRAAPHLVEIDRWSEFYGMTDAEIGFCTSLPHGFWPNYNQGVPLPIFSVNRDVTDLLAAPNEVVSAWP